MSARRSQKARLGDEPRFTDAAMTFDEIARELGTSKQAVWSLYQNGLRKLRQGARLRRVRELRALAQSKEAAD
jgi:DNA-directed RNA polymerase sigma subunit (sigma70/sigma32)